MSSTWKVPEAKKGFGVELEFHVPSPTHQDVENEKFKFFSEFACDDWLSNYFGLKEDESCGQNDWRGDYWEGLEINLGIFPLNRGGLVHFRKILDVIYHDIKLLKKEVNCKVPFTKNCGFHVHLSEGLFESKDSIDNFSNLFKRFQRDIFKRLVHGSRTNNDCVGHLCAGDDGISYDHFMCVNHSEYHKTIEVRHAGMTANKDSLVNWIKFVSLMHDMAHNVDAEKIKPKESLISFLKEYPVPKWIGKDKFLQWTVLPKRSRFPLTM
jgi:hypothetical protein